MFRCAENKNAIVVIASTLLVLLAIGCSRESIEPSNTQHINIAPSVEITSESDVDIFFEDQVINQSENCGKEITVTFRCADEETRRKLLAWLVKSKHFEESEKVKRPFLWLAQIQKNKDGETIIEPLVEPVETVEASDDSTQKSKLSFMLTRQFRLRCN